MKSAFLIVITVVAMIGMMIPSSFADHAEVAIVTVDESGFSQTCAESQGGSGCYTPVTATVDVGGVVTMTNTDPTGVHTYTSGTVDGFTPSPDGVFDTGVLMSGDAFEWIPETAGEQPYYCMLHTWMIGTIIVQEAHADDNVEEFVPYIDRAITSNLRITDAFGNILNSISVNQQVQLTIDIVNQQNQDLPFTYWVVINGTQFHESWISGSLSSGQSFSPIVSWIPTESGGTYDISAHVVDNIDDKNFLSTSLQTSIFVPAPPEPTPVVTNTIVTVNKSGFSQTCAESQGGSGCYTPLTAVVNYGDTVNMTNTDLTGVHTFTSGTVDGFSPSPNQIFDSGVLMSGDAFHWQANVSGEQPYYCMLHTWMVGTIVVQGTASEEAVAAQAAAIEAAQEDAAEAAAQAAAELAAAQAAAELAAVEAAAELAAAQAAAELAAVEAASELAAAQAAAELAAAEAAAQVPESQIPITLITSTGQTTYDIGDMVDVLVTATGFTGTQKVAIDVTDPRGNTVVSRSINLSPNITEDIEFRLSEDFKTGTYKVTTTTSDNGDAVLSTSHFKIKSQFNSFTISDVIVSDQQGNSSGLEAGEMGFIKVNLTSTKSIATLVTVNLFDSELTSIGIGSVQTTLASGESEIILSFMIPDDAAIGSADIYVNAFSDWPSNGGTALTSELASMEDIS